MGRRLVPRGGRGDEFRVANEWEDKKTEEIRSSTADGSDLG